MIRRGERGSTLAWTAALLASVLVPLMMLAGDGSRLFMVYTRLAAATDLACADTGYMLTDRQTFLNSGPAGTRMVTKTWAQQAAGDFVNSLSALHIPISASNFNYQLNGNSIRCTGTATFPLLMNPGQSITMSHVSVDKVRFVSP